MRAVLSKLRPARGRLIFGGGSAGARGAMVLLDEVAKLPMEARMAWILLTEMAYHIMELYTECCI